MGEISQILSTLHGTIVSCLDDDPVRSIWVVVAAALLGDSDGLGMAVGEKTAENAGAERDVRMVVILRIDIMRY